jgi:mannitol operon transcriptional antiterminator
LTDDNVQTIRNFLKNNIENVTEKKHYLKTKQNESTAVGKEKGIVLGILEELNDIQQSIQAVFRNFQVFRAPVLRSHEQIMEAIVIHAEEEKLLTDSKAVIEALKDREKLGGLGIPNTEMGLFHCRHKSIKELIFQIASIEEPIDIKGMDGKQMPMRHLLLMMAPEELSLRKQEIISLLSTSLIESNEAIMIFSSSNEDLIRNKLEKIFLDYLQNNIIRE